MPWLRDLLAWLREGLDWLLHGPAGPAPGPTGAGRFRDPARQRVIPFRLYAPAPGDGPAPVVILSHGLGGSREGAAYLGEALSRHGYAVFALQHPGTDDSLLVGARGREDKERRLRAAARRTDAVLERFRDLAVALDGIAVMNRQGRLAGRLDLGRVGMIGHSLGARGVMAAAGQRMGPLGTRFHDPRIRAGVVLSPNLPSAGSDPALAYRAARIPLLHVTGTRDGMPLGGASFDPATRTLPFQLIQAPEQYLLVLDGATHETFAGRPGHGAAQARHLALVARAVLLFLDAQLKGDAEARRALRQVFPLDLGPGDRFLTK